MRRREDGSQQGRVEEAASERSQHVTVRREGRLKSRARQSRAGKSKNLKMNIK